MPRFLIEASHEPETLACAKVVQVFLTTGSHYLTNTEWGCLDGQHRSWLIVDADSREQARSLLPAALRAQARIVALKRFTMEQADELFALHRPAHQPTPQAALSPGQHPATQAA